MNLTNIRKAIYTIGNTISGSGFFYEEAPDDTHFPYTVYHLLNSSKERISVNNITENISIQFNIVDKRITSSGNKITSAAIEVVADDLTNKFDNNTISVTGFNKLIFKRTLITPSMIIEDGNYWQIVIRYDLLISQ